MKNKRIIPLILVILLFLTCYDDLSLSSVNAATRIRISTSSIKLVVGKTKTVKLVGLTKNQSKKVKWKSNNKKIATVNKNGKITAKKSGKTTIIGTYKGKKYKCKVTVIYNSNSYINADKEITVNVGEKKQIYIKTDRGFGVTWNRSNNCVDLAWGNWNPDYSVGLYITGKYKGTSIITVYDTNKPQVGTIITVKVVSPVTGVKISKNTMDIGVGESEKLSVSTLPSDADDNTILWTSSDTSVATVDSEGKVLGVKKGKATITARAPSGVYATCTIIVHDVIITTPVLPQSVSSYDYRGRTETRASIKEISFEKSRNYNGTFSVKVYFTGEMTYSKSAYVSRSCEVGYKLYDSSNIVVASGVFYSDKVLTGEMFKGYTYISSNLEEGEYRLVLLDVN